MDFIATMLPTIVANGDIITFDIKGAVGVVGLIGMILTWYFKYRDKKDTYAKVEKDSRDKEMMRLREYAEKFHMLRMEILGSNAIDGDILVAKVNREWEAINTSSKKK